MNIIREVKLRARHIILPAVWVSLFGYFSYHAIQGERGLLSYFRMQNEVAKAEYALEQISAQRALYAHRVELLHPRHIDPDMLEEQSRQNLNQLHSDEVVIFIPSRLQ